MAVLSKPVRPVPSILLNRDRAIITRIQELQIRQKFPFLGLPAELRNIIYDMCIDFGGIEKFFNEYYARLKDSQVPDKVYPPRHFKKTPTVLLICRAIYTEAICLLPTKPINFHHGIFDIYGVDGVVSKNVLRNISEINITTKGHPVLQRNILKESWCGYMDLFTHLAQILSAGHKLKKLTIDFSDEALVQHTTHCWNLATIKCDFRNHIKEAFGNLRCVRGVEYVDIKITGVPSAFTQELKARMESKPITLLDLPGELRNKIYGYAADPSDIGAQVARTMERWTDKTQGPLYPKRSTPTVLLMNRQIYGEASKVMMKKPLDLVLPSNHALQKQTEVPNMLRFITANTLQQVKHLRISVESWEWVYSLDRFLPALATKHSLNTFHFNFKDSLKKSIMEDVTKKYPDSSLHVSLSGLAQIRGVPKVTFGGDLPEVYTAPLMEIMQSLCFVAALPTPMAVRGNGTVLDADAEDA